MTPDRLSRRERIAGARSFLFVPGNRPDRFDKARASGADLVICDLEDAVPPALKDAARDAVRAWLDAGGTAVLRINAADTPWFEADRALCSRPGVEGVMLAKAAAGSALEMISATAPTIGLVESAIGVQAMDAIARTPGVARLAFGAIDLALDLGLARSADCALDSVRLQMVIACRSAGLPRPVAGVTTELMDAKAVAEDTRRAMSLGFSAKLCIHPRQVPWVHQAFRPDPEEIRRARRIIDADAAAKGAAVAVDGQMIDTPLVEQARRVLAIQARQV